MGGTGRVLSRMVTGLDMCFRKLSKAAVRRQGWRSKAGGREGKQEALP